MYINFVTFFPVETPEFLLIIFGHLLGIHIITPEKPLDKQALLVLLVAFIPLFCNYCVLFL